MSARIAIGDSVFDPGTRQLTRGESSVRLSPKGFELLAALLASRPRAVSREELRDRLWPGTFVSYTALPRLVSELRKALGDDRHAARYVRNVHGFGYAFCGSAAELPGDGDAAAPTGGSYEVVIGERVIPLGAGENLIGRNPECPIRLTSGKASRRHARILVRAAGATLEDLGSRNGTYWRGNRVESAVALSDGDELGVGEVVMIFRSTAALASTEQHPA